MTAWVQGAVVGLLLGAGLVIVLLRLPVLRKVDLDARLAPYLRDAARPSTLLGRTPTATFPGLRRLLGPVVHDAARREGPSVGR